MTSLISTFLSIFLIITGLVGVASAQFPQARRNEERRQRAIEADQKRQKENADNAATFTLPQPKPSVVNKNVRIVLSSAAKNTFDEAARSTVSRVKDGDALWMFMKFDTKLGDYVRTVPDHDNDKAYRYYLLADISPLNDPTVLARNVIWFTREDLELKELKVNLSPGIVGRNAALPFFLDVAATRSPGTWNNQIRIANRNTAPRTAAEDLASAELAFDLTGSVTKYPAIKADYESMVLRGTADRSILPAPGSFYSLPMKTNIQNKLKEDGIKPLRFFYAADDWSEFGTSTLDRIPRRVMYAVFTYREKEDCMYGIAKLTQTMDMMTSTFSGDTIELTKGIKTACSEVE